jgi:hypothetical protein
MISFYYQVHTILNAQLLIPLPWPMASTAANTSKGRNPQQIIGAMEDTLNLRTPRIAAMQMTL